MKPEQHGLYVPDAVHEVITALRDGKLSFMLASEPQPKVKDLSSRISTIKVRREANMELNSCLFMP